MMSLHNLGTKKKVKETAWDLRSKKNWLGKPSNRNPRIQDIYNNQQKKKKKLG